MSCLIAASSVSLVERIAVTLRLSDRIESVSALSDRLTLASCSACAESAAALLAREAVKSSWSLMNSVFDAKHPVDTRVAQTRTSGDAFIIPENTIRLRET
jgi:hypothetical protein